MSALTRIGTSLLVVLVEGTAGCGATGSPIGIDGGPPIEVDASCGRDGSLPCPLGDGGLDARPGFVDVGPPLAPVFPVGAWTSAIAFPGGPPVAEMTIVLDARPTAGVVRGIFGSLGSSTSIELDVLEGGALVLGRSPIVVRAQSALACLGSDFDFVPELRFVDEDGDGTFETLDSFGAYGATRTLQAGGGPPLESGPLAPSARPSLDTTSPALTLVPDPPLLSAELLVLEASEPIEPSFAPRLVGPRTLPLVPDAGASAAARWTLDARGAPAGHYVLELGAPHDLIGNAASALPVLEVDLASPGPPPIDDLDARVLAVESEGGNFVVGDDPGEVPLAGATSIGGVGRTAVAIDASVGHHAIEFTVRFEASADALGSMAMPYYLLFDETGRRVYVEPLYLTLDQPPGLPTFAQSTTVFQQSLPFDAPRAGVYSLVFLPEGIEAPRECGTTADPAVQGITLDAIQLR